MSAKPCHQISLVRLCGPPTLASRSIHHRPGAVTLEHIILHKQHGPRHYKPPKANEHTENFKFKMAGSERNMLSLTESLELT